MSLIALLACTASDGETGSPDDSSTPDDLWAYRDCRATEARTLDGQTVSLWEYDYDALGQLVEKREDPDANGIFDAVIRWGYEDGLLAWAGLDGNGDGALDYRVFYSWDSDGHKVLQETDLDDDDSIERIDAWVYQGGLLREERLDTDYETNADTFGTWTYDTSDRPSGLVWTGRAPRSTEAWTYDGDWTEHTLRDHNSDLVLARDGARHDEDLLVETWQDIEGDGVVDLAATLAYDDGILIGETGTGYTGEEVAWTSATTLRYDAVGRRVERTITTTQSGGETVDAFVTTWVCAD